jgi:hypothetical protein
MAVFSSSMIPNNEENFASAALFLSIVLAAS